MWWKKMYMKIYSQNKMQKNHFLDKCWGDARRWDSLVADVRCVCVHHKHTCSHSAPSLMRTTQLTSCALQSMLSSQQPIVESLPHINSLRINYVLVFIHYNHLSRKGANGAHQKGLYKNSPHIHIQKDTTNIYTTVNH